MAIGAITLTLAHAASHQHPGAENKGLEGVSHSQAHGPLLSGTCTFKAASPVPQRSPRGQSGSQRILRAAMPWRFLWGFLHGGLTNPVNGLSLSHTSHAQGSNRMPQHLPGPPQCPLTLPSRGCSVHLHPPLRRALTAALHLAFLASLSQLVIHNPAAGFPQLSHVVLSVL